MKRVVTSLLFTVLLLLAASSIIAQQASHPFTVGDLLKVRRVSDPQVSPKGDMIAYTIGDVDRNANKIITQIYVVPIGGGEARQLTNAPQSSTSPRWSPDGSRLAFISARDGGAQIWTIDISSGELKKVTEISTGAGDPIWSRDGRWLAFTSEVYPECHNDACNKQRAEAASQSKVKARLIDNLLYRHWNAWAEGKRTHLFVISSDGGEARELTPGDVDAPPIQGGAGDYAFSPDGDELAFAMNSEKQLATSTNGDIFLVSVRGGHTRPVTKSNMADDGHPVYSPDNHYIAYHAQVRPGYEADRWRLMLYDRKTTRTRPLTENVDMSVSSLVFSPDSQKIYFSALERGHQPSYSISVSGGQPVKIVDGYNDHVSLTSDGHTLVFQRSSTERADEIYTANVDGSNVRQITHTNDEFMAGFNLRPAEEVTWTGAAGAKVSGWIVKPANFNSNRHWPMLVLIHGGPQGAWNDNWGYRWNPEVFANAGYVVFTPNPRGSTGYGSRFTEDISGDWSGKVYTDIMNGVAHVISLGYVDKNRIGAAGGSFGGYMVDWIEGHNNDPRFQFKALVSHAGVYDLTSMYGATEELWFPEWEFHGTPWTNPEMYARNSPHMFVQNFKTPLMVTHGEIDFRVPYTQGLELFTALQRQGVDSRLLFFPDEGHWILKPQNSELWYTTVLQWFDKHLK